MTARTFEDSTGAVWEVFEVQRSSQKAQAVSAGLELGWLAFACGDRRRRLAPYPKEWQNADAAELERLCGLARAARESAVPRDVTGRETRDAAVAPLRSRVPRIRPSRQAREAGSAGELPILASATSTDSVESTVRAFAQQARSNGLPAIEAMVQLKSLLARVYTDESSVARDLRTVRRWFVEAYYFDRAAPPGAPDQSR